MRIAVIAANGRSGKAFVEEALNSGHEVRAGFYHTDTLTPHEHLTTIKCDATAVGDLANLLNGQDAVVSFVGHTRRSTPTVQTDSMRALVTAMHTAGLKRIISLTGTGVRFPGDRITIVDRILNISISLIDPRRVRDGIDHVDVLKESDLDWTVLRVLKLQNTTPKPYQLRLHGPTKWYVSRQEVGQAALEILEHKSFIRQAPIIGKP